MQQEWDDNWLVFKPFGGRIYSYPGHTKINGVHGNVGAVTGLYGFATLVLGSLSFSVIETIVVLLFALYDAESDFWSE